MKSPEQRIGTFDYKRFWLDLKAVKDRSGLSWRDVAHQTGVLSSTLTRIGHVDGRALHVETLAALICWSALDPMEYISYNENFDPGLK